MKGMEDVGEPAGKHPERGKNAGFDFPFHPRSPSCPSRSSCPNPPEAVSSHAPTREGRAKRIESGGPGLVDSAAT